MKKDPIRRRWLRDNTDPLDLPSLNLRLREHRRQLTSLPSYFRGRGFQYLLENEGFDARNFIEDKISERGAPIALFDSGGGFLNFSGDVKRVFGREVYVVALNPSVPAIPKNPDARSEFINNIREDAARSIKVASSKIPGKNVDEVVEQHLKRLRDAEDNMKLIDEHHVGFIENYSPTREFDVVTDFFGPIYYHEGRIGHSTLNQMLKVYEGMLRDGGSLICGCTSKIWGEIKLSVKNEFGSDSSHASEKGFILMPQEPLSKKVYEIKKQMI